MPLENLLHVNDLADLRPEDIDNIGKIHGEKFADKLNGIKTNQVRNIYSSVLAIRTKLKNADAITEEINRDLILLKPKMAYAAGRQKAVKPFYELLSQAIDSAVKSKDSVRGVSNFISLVEAVVAYHKFYGGKDK